MNKGFTLVELVVTIAIMTLLGTALIVMITISSSIYKKQTAEVNVQYQAQMASGQLQDLILSANNGMRWDEANSVLYLYSAEFDESGAYTKKTTTITWNQADKRLFFENDKTTTPEVLANEVTNFDVAIYDKLGNMLASTVSEITQADGSKKEIHSYDDSMDAHNIVVRYAYDFDGRTYNETATCTLRNTILVSSDTNPDKYYSSLPNSTGDKVNAVVVAVPNISTNHLWVGENTGDFPFTTEIFGFNVTDTSFVWSFGHPYTDKNDGSDVVLNDKGTSIDTTTGKVTIGLTERDNFNVIGTSKMSETLAAAGNGTPKSAAVMFYPKYIVSANASSPNLATFDYINDTDLKYQVKVTVKNGIGNDTEKGQVLSKLSVAVTNNKGESIFTEDNNKQNSVLDDLSYVGGYSSADSYTYVFEQILKNPPKDYSFVYTMTCNGYGINTQSSVSAALDKPYEYTGFKVVSSSNTKVYAGQEIAVRAYITKHYLVGEGLDEIIDVTDQATLALSAGTDIAQFENDVLRVNKGISSGNITVGARYSDGLGKEWNSSKSFVVKPIEGHLTQTGSAKGSSVPSYAFMTAGEGDTVLELLAENVESGPEVTKITNVEIFDMQGNEFPQVLTGSVHNNGKQVKLNTGSEFEVKYDLDNGKKSSNPYPSKVAMVKVEFGGSYNNQLSTDPYNFEYGGTSFSSGIYETFYVLIGNKNIVNGPGGTIIYDAFIPSYNIQTQSPPLSPFTEDDGKNPIKGKGYLLLDGGKNWTFDTRWDILHLHSARLYQGVTDQNGITVTKDSTGSYWK